MKPSKCAVAIVLAAVVAIGGFGAASAQEARQPSSPGLSNQQLAPPQGTRVPRSPTTGATGFTAAENALKARFCCDSGSGSSGSGCTEYDPETHVCTKDFVLNCDGDWSCSGTNCSCQ